MVPRGRSPPLDAGRDLRNTAAVIGAPEPLEPAPPTGLGGRAVHGILALGLEKTVALGIALYLPRNLGLADYGRYAFLLSYLGFFQALPDTALEAVLVARMARAAAEEAGALAGPGARVRLAASLVGGVAGLALLALAVHDAELLCGGVVGAAGLVASAATPYRALLRARLRMSAYVGLLAAQAALAVGLLAAVVVAGGGLVAVFAAVSAAAAPVLRVLAPATLLGATGAVLTNLLVAVGRQRTLLRVTAGAAAGMIALGAALVPTYGAVGAAAAFVAVSLAGQVALLALPATRAEVAPVLAATVPPLALGAGAVAAAVALGPSVPVGAALLLGAYPAALCLTGTVTRADLARWRT